MSSSDSLAGAGTIARASWTIWRRHVGTSLGVGRRAVDAGIVGAVVLCAALAALVSALVIGTIGAAGALPASVDHLPFTRITAAGVLIGGTLPQLLLAATRPRSTALGDLAAVLPVGRSALALGERMPSVLLGAGFALVLSAPLAAFLGLLFQTEPARAVGAIGAHLVLLAFAAVACPVAFELVYAGACRLRLPHAYATGAAAIVLIVTLVAVAGPALVPRPYETSGLATLSPVEAVAVLAASDPTAPILAAAASLIAWTLLAAALAVLVVRHPPRARPVDITRALVGMRMPRSERAAAIALHALPLARLPQLLLLGAGPVLVSVALATPAARDFPAISEPLTGVPLVAPFAIAMFAFGLTHPNSWWVRATGRTHRTIAGERLAAGALVAAPSVLASAVLLVATGVVDPGTAALRVSLGLVLWLAASVAGILTPWSQLSPLATTITSAVSFLLFAAAAIPLQLAVDTWFPGSVLATAVAVTVSALLLLALWAGLTRRRGDDDLEIA
ncbi:MAG: hypothetical protein DI534_06070 [Leifsonia xyli]|nr:MAG: hypothetical protein DI534_06070 [Leifsonia xyli]